MAMATADVQEFCLKWNSHHSTVISVLDSLLARERLVDVTLACDGQFINVHRFMLFACSSYFEELLSQQPEKQAVVFLKDVPFADLKALVDYMYKGEVNVAQDQLPSFLRTAESLQIKGLVESEKPGNKSPPSLPERSELVKGKSSLNSVPSHMNAAFSHSQINVTKQQKIVLPSRSAAPIEFLRETNDDEELEEEEEPQHVIETEIESDDPYMGIRQYQDESEIDEMDDQFEATENWNSHNGDDDGWSTSNSADGLSCTNTSDITISNTTTLAKNTGYSIHDHLKNKSASAGPSRSGRPSNSTSANLTGKKLKKKKKRETVDGDFNCPQCGREYRNKESLRRHVRVECGVAPSFRCPHCPFKTKYRHTLKNHIQKIH